MSLTEKITSNNELKLLNFICTSRSDYHDLNRSVWKKAKFWNYFYLSLIFVVVTISFLPLFYISDNDYNDLHSTWMLSLNIVIFVILFFDYFFRWITYPIRVKDRSINPLFFFIFTATNLVMILSLVPSLLFILVSSGIGNAEFIKATKLLSVFKIFRFILLLNIFPSFKLLTEVFVRNRTIILTLLISIIALVFIFALIVYSVEKEAENSQIKTYGDSLYYSFIAITTVGFGDIACVTVQGKVMSIILGVLGTIAFSIPFAAVIATFTTKVQEKYKHTSIDNGVYQPSSVEKLWTKFMKTRELESDLKSASLVLKNFSKKENENIFERIVELVGGQENICEIIKNENETIVKIYEIRKLTNDFHVLTNIMDIEYVIEK